MSWTGMPSVIAITVSMPGVDRLVDRGGGEARRNEDHRGVGAALVDRLLDRVEDRDALDVLAALARGDAGDHVGAVVAVAQPVEGALAAGQAGDDELRVVVDDDAHQPLAPLASSTTFSAAPSIVFSRCRLVEVGLGEQRQALLGVGAVEADDQRHVDARSARRPR